MSAESPRQLQLPISENVPNKRLQLYRTSESSNPRHYPSKDQLPLPHITVPKEFGTNQYDLPEFRVPGESIAVPLTPNNIFRDEESLNLSELGGSLQLVKTIYELSLETPSERIDRTRDMKTMEKTVVMWGYSPTEENVQTFISAFDQAVTERKNDRYEQYSSFWESIQNNKPVAVFEYKSEELVAD